MGRFDVAINNISIMYNIHNYYYLNISLLSWDFKNIAKGTWPAFSRILSISD